jgi:Conjugal transfer protein TraD
MKARDRQRLETQLKRLKDKHHQLTHDIGHTSRRLREATRSERQKRLIRFGELVEFVDLAHIDLSTLVGGLSDLKQHLLDPSTAANCKNAGEPLLDTYLQRKWHRKHPSTHITSNVAQQIGNAQEEN